jgi:toxin ParE1/3/4
MEIVFTDKADQDLIRIYSYLTDRNPKAADNLVRGIDRKLKNLSAFPFIGRARPKLGEDIRSLVVGNHLIFYRVYSDCIAIVRIIDGRMDIDEEFRR